MFYQDIMITKNFGEINPDSVVNLFSQAPVALAMLMGDDFLIESANKHILELWGKTDSVIGLPLIEGLPEIKEQAFPSILKEVYDTGKPFHGYKVSCFLEREGVLGEYFFDFAYSPVYSTDNKIIGVSVVATDVTSHVRSEKELVASELRFKELILNSDYSTAIYKGENFIIELANDKMLRTWGKDKSVIGMRLEDALPELEGQPFIELLQNVYRTGIPYESTEDRADLVVDGKLQTYYYNFTYKPIRDANGEIYAILNMAVNVTDLVKSRETLKENAEMLKLSEAKYKQLSEAMPQIIWTTTADGKFTYFNEKFSLHLGISKEEKESADFSSLIHPDDFPQVAAAWYHAGENKCDFEVEYRALNHQTGAYTWLLTRAVPDLDADGNIKQWIGSSTDINEFKNLQTQKDTFLGMASHELKTPLTSMKIYAQVLERALTKAGDEKNAEFARKMDEQVVKLTSLIGDLLDVTKINSGKIQLNETHFELSQLMNEVVEEQQLSSRHKITIESEKVANVFADRNRIGQVMSNLISNAVKYSPDADEVLVSTKIVNENVEFSVTDFGIGMPADKKDKVFEQYYRVNGGDENHFPGLGLGLYIAAEIIERSNGKIWVNSELGKGSTFCFSLTLSN